MKKAIILDLDNTIYPVSSISKKLFKNLFANIENSGEFEGSFEDVKTEIQRTPFQKVAKAFSFSSDLLEQCLTILAELSCDFEMQTFDDYKYVQELTHKKYLVTSGFTKLQHSKVKQLGIRNDFEAIHIIDLQTENRTKKDAFQQILNDGNYAEKEVLVIGDDIYSEIQAAKDLGIDYVIYDKIEKYTELKSPFLIRDFKDLKEFV